MRSHKPRQAGAIPVFRNCGLRTIFSKQGTIIMPLFHIQDDDRPAFVVADNFVEALRKWESAVADENDGEAFDPEGISHIADDTDLIVDTDWVKPLFIPAAE